MRIAILSDIHANREAFEAVLDAVHNLAPDQIVLLGDIVGYGPDPVFAVDKAAELADRGALCILGNHDRSALRKNWPFVETHREPGFLFSHGHHFKAVESAATGADRVHITGHEHPAITVSDGAGLRLKLPALVREKITGSRERWLLPAFSPWAAGGGYRSAQPLEQWICAPSRVWRHEAPPREAK